jgi:hypothetical protein
MPPTALASDMESTRLSDWPERLNAYIESRRKAVFLWGENDCAMFCAGAIEAMTGQNPLADWDVSEHQAISERGEVSEFVSQFLGDAIPVLQARRGDIAITAEGSLGVVIGNRVATPTDKGVAFAPLSRYAHAWRVE